MPLPNRTARELAAARDILAVVVFFTLAIWGGREFLNSPLFRKDRLTKAEATEDIDDFFSRIGKVRPAQQGAAPDYAALKAATIEEAGKGLDETGRIRTKDLAYILFRSAAQFGDADTRPYWHYPRYIRDPERRFPPFTVDYRSDKFIIDGAADPALTGSEVLALDGIPFADLIKPALERISGETPRYRSYAFCRDQYFWWNFADLLSGKEKFSLKLKGTDGKIRAKPASALTAMEFRQLAPRPAEQKKYIFAQKKTAWLELAGMDYSRNDRSEYDKFFREIAQLRITDLVLDLRRSDAGDIRMADFLLSCLTARGTGGVALKPGKPFAVRTTLLVGPGTRGPAAALAARLRRLKAGEILGWETGGSAAYFGGEKRFRLPASGIEYGVPARYYSAPGQIPPVPILPDVQFTDSLLRPYKGDIRSFVLDRISKRKLAAP